MKAIVSVSDLRHTYPAKGKAPAREALRGVSFSVEAGEAFALLGKKKGKELTDERKKDRERLVKKIQGLS